MEELNETTLTKFSAFLRLIDATLTDLEKAQFMQLMCYKACDELGSLAAKRYIEEQALAGLQRARVLQKMRIESLESDKEH